MSFSAEVKEELAEMVPSEFSLFTAELQGLLLYGAKLTEKEGGTALQRTRGKCEEILYIHKKNG